VRLTPYFLYKKKRKKHKIIDVPNFPDNLFDNTIKFIDLEKTIPEFKEADVIIIILSSYFIASDLIQDTVIPKVFKQITSKSKLFPIVVEPCPIKLITWLTSKNVMAYGKKGDVGRKGTSMILCFSPIHTLKFSCKKYKLSEKSIKS
jgi:hypothetical protein